MSNKNEKNKKKKMKSRWNAACDNMRRTEDDDEKTTWKVDSLFF